MNTAGHGIRHRGGRRIVPRIAGMYKCFAHVVDGFQDRAGELERRAGAGHAESSFITTRVGQFETDGRLAGSGVAKRLFRRGTPSVTSMHDGAH